MTAIAWDGKTLAADRMAVTYDRIIRPGVTKIKAFDNGIVAGVSGPASSLNAFFDWIKRGAMVLDYPSNLDPEAGYFLVNASGTGKSFDDKGFSANVDAPFAFGSGAEACLGAMYAGATAREAIEIATKIYASVGEGIDELPTPGKPEPTTGIVDLRDNALTPQKQICILDRKAEARLDEEMAFKEITREIE